MKKHGPILAFDRESVRSYDADGRLHVAFSNISKSNVSPYYGSEIPGYIELGLDPTKVYRLWRDPDELAKGAASFRNLPILRRHIQVSADDPSKEDVIGSIGSDVVFNNPYLGASLCFWDSEAIAGIESGQLVELSPAYRYIAIMVPGVTPDGEPFDGRMTDILGNHLATVEVGRTGKDVVVADSNPFTPKQEIPAMKYTKLGLALKVALSAASPKIAQDSGLPALVGKATKKGFDKDAIKGKLLAMDADFDAENLDEIIDAILGVEQNPEPETPPTAVGDEGDGLAAFLKGKLSDEDYASAMGMMDKSDEPKGMDESEVDEKVNEGVSAAMDSMRKEFRDLQSAQSAVRNVVGDVIGMDSAEQVYRFALDHMKVDHKETPATGLRNLFAVANSVAAPKQPVIASDSASIASIPGLARFGR